MVVTGFEPVDLLDGILACVTQLESGRAEVENRYPRSVRPEGNPAARAAVAEVFAAADREWRGMGVIPASGLGLAPAYAGFDARRRFEVADAAAAPAGMCRSGEVLRGVAKPTDCAAFGTACTPAHPLGATMVSSEGACAAYFRYRARPAA
jgi:hydrogenase expression/formation protein HypD